MNKRIIFVDDEPSLLQGLQRGLRPMRKDWDMEFADGGKAALEVLANRRFDVIVTDLRMPEMDGIQLLCEIVKQHPHMVRITLSGSDRELIMTAVGHAHFCLLKPCETENLKGTLVAACAFHDLLQKIRGRLGDIKQEREDADLGKIIDAIVTVARAEWKSVGFAAEVAADLPLVSCAPDEIMLALLNITLNAIQAIQDAAARRRDYNGVVTVSARRDRTHVEIKVADTGPGIPEELRSKVFTAFFTTKRVGDGTGQGLAIAKMIVLEKHGGTVSFETQLGKGSQFVVRLPIKT